LSNLTKGLILVAVILAIGAGLVIWKKKTGGAEESFNSISKHEIEILLADVADKNPLALKRFAEDQDLKKKQLESLKQLMAFAVEAQKEGYAAEPATRQELRNIRSQVVASLYDQEVNKDKGPMPQFGFITEDQVNQFWGEDKNGQTGSGFFSGLLDKIGLGGSGAARTHEAEFDQFVNDKMEMIKQNDPDHAPEPLTDDQRNQAREFFAKVKIYEKQADDEVNKRHDTPEETDRWKKFKERTDLQVKLEQAQFLAGVYSKEVADKIKASDQDITNYIAQHPELDPKEKRAKAEAILQRAKNGEDFAALANENSDDPGNKNAKGEPQGGLYTNVQKGRMVKPFEDAALSLEPGQIYPDIVESDFGYHIIKLEKKTDAKDTSGNPSQTYDVRHILVATTYQDPNEQGSRPMPIKEYVRQKIEDERRKTLIDDVVAKSGVTVAEDFDIPQVSDQQIQDMMKKQQQNQLGNPDMDEPPPPAKGDKKEAKKSK
jgi:hypothetical protein